MKNNIFLSMIIIAIVFLSCAYPDTTTKNKKSKNKKSTGINIKNSEQEPDSLIQQFLHDSICSIIINADQVIVKHIIRKPHVESNKKDTSYYNAEDSVGKLSKKQMGFLQYALLTDSTWNWSKIKIKHAYEPELICLFEKGRSSVSVLISPASQEFGFGYTNILIKKEYKADRLINNFIAGLRKMKKTEPKKEPIVEPKKVIKVEPKVDETR